MERNSIVIAKVTAAENSNKRGNDLLKENKYENAVEWFTAAIRLIPDKADFYYNKCFALMKLSRFRDALEVANKCVQLDPDYYVAHLFKSVCEIELKDFISAAVTFHIVLENDVKNILYKELFDISDSEIVYVAKFSSHHRNKNFAAALQTADEALLHNSRKLYSLLKAAALALLKNFAEANHYTSFIHDVKNNFNSESLSYRGLCHYYLGNVEKAMLFLLVSHLTSPVNHRFISLCDRATEVALLKESAKASINIQLYRTAYDLYSAALLVDPSNEWGNAKLYFNRSIVAVKTGNKLNAISDCSSAIQLNKTYLKAYLRRAKLYSDLYMFQKSFEDYTRVCDLTYCDEYIALREKMKKMLNSQQNSDTTEIEIDNDVVVVADIPPDAVLHRTSVNY